MAIFSHNISFLVDHEAGLVHIDIIAALIFAKQELNVALAVSIKHTHYFLQFKGLPIVVE